MPKGLPPTMKQMLESVIDTMPLMTGMDLSKYKEPPEVQPLTNYAVQGAAVDAAFTHLGAKLQHPIHQTLTLKKGGLLLVDDMGVTYTSPPWGVNVDGKIKKPQMSYIQPLSVMSAGSVGVGVYDGQAYAPEELYPNEVAGSEKHRKIEALHYFEHHLQQLAQTGHLPPQCVTPEGPQLRVSDATVVPVWEDLTKMPWLAQGKPPGAYLLEQVPQALKESCLCMRWGSLVGLYRAVSIRAHPILPYGGGLPVPDSHSWGYPAFEWVTGLPGKGWGFMRGAGDPHYMIESVGSHGSKGFRLPTLISHPDTLAKAVQSGGWVITASPVYVLRIGLSSQGMVSRIGLPFTRQDLQALGAGYCVFPDLPLLSKV